MNEYLEEQLVHDRLKEMRDAAHRAAIADQLRERHHHKPVRVTLGQWLIRLGERLVRNPAIA